MDMSAVDTMFHDSPDLVIHRTDMGCLEPTGWAQSLAFVDAEVLSPACRACDYVYIDYVRRSRSSSCHLLHTINCQNYITLHSTVARARPSVRCIVLLEQSRYQTLCLLLAAV